MVPTSIDKRPVAGLEGQNGLFATTAYDEATKQYIVKIVNTSDEAQEVKLDFKGLKGKFDKANVISFHAEEKDENTLDHPNTVKPVEYNELFDATAAPVVRVGAKTFKIFRF